MKSTLLALCMFITLASVAEDGPWVTLDRKIHNLGKVVQGTVASDTVRFSNTGNAPLVLYHVLTDCHCTDVDYTCDTIAPGAGGYIAVTYQSPANDRGDFRQAVRIRSNAVNHREIVYIEGTVVRK